MAVHRAVCAGAHTAEASPSVAEAPVVSEAVGPAHGPGEDNSALQLGRGEQ